jgi:ribosome-binding protein aMBF1 (putative translation factor)
MENFLSFSRVAKQALESKGMSTNQLADKIMFRKDHVASVVAGETYPVGGMLTAICSVLDLDDSKMAQLVMMEKEEKQDASEKLAITFRKFVTKEMGGGAEPSGEQPKKLFIVN